MLCFRSVVPQAPFPFARVFPPAAAAYYAADELLLYSGAYHLGSLQVGCGGRHCAKEVLPPYAFPLLLAPPTAFALENNIRSSSSSNNNSTSRMALASASQMRGNNRVLLLSGPDACSSIFTSLESIPLNGYEFVRLPLMLLLLSS